MGVDLGSRGQVGPWNARRASTRFPPCVLSALRSELQRLGVPVLGLDIRSLSQDPGARYDAIYVKREP